MRRDKHRMGAGSEIEYKGLYMQVHLNFRKLRMWTIVIFKKQRKHFVKKKKDSNTSFNVFVAGLDLSTKINLCTTFKEYNDCLEQAIIILKLQKK